VEFTTGFAKASDEQTAKLRDLVTRLGALAALADAAVEGAQQTSAATQQQMASLGELTTTSQRLSEAATRLSETVRRFETSSSAS
jgi:methyl-accepting chemotaxis protein